MGFIDHHELLILKQDFFIEWNGLFDGYAAVVIQFQIRGIAAGGQYAVP